MANDIRINMNLSNEQILDMRATLNHIPDGFNTAASRGLNRTIEKSRTDAKKQITNKYAIKPGLVLSAFSMDKAKKTNLNAKLKSKGKALPLDSFAHRVSSTMSTSRKPVFVPSLDDFRLVRQKLWNINVEVKKGQSNRYDNAFMAKFGSNLRIALRMRDIARPLYGPSITTMLEQPAVYPVIETEINTTLARELTRAMDVVIMQFNRR